MKYSIFGVIAACACTIPAGPNAQEAIAKFNAPLARPATQMTLRSTTDIAVLRPVIEAFVTANADVAVIFEQWGSNALFDASLAACENETPSVDAIFSSGVHQMLDLVNRACASPYISDLTRDLPISRRWRNELWGITKEPAVMIYNTDLVAAGDVPQTRFALLDLMRRSEAKYQGKIATYDIEVSGLGYLFAFMDSLEATTFGALIEGFARTDAVATCCSSEIIKGVAAGKYLIAYNVLGSYVDSQSASNIGVIQPQDYTLFLSRAYMIPKAATNKGAAARLLDFMVSREGRALLQAQNLIYEDDDAQFPLAPSGERAIAIEPTLLVASDQHQKMRFIDLWRSAFD